MHVLADFGTTLQNEIEVFGFISRADDDPRAFSLLAMVISLFETGMLSIGAGLFEADTGHLSADGMATRLADAMRRGAMARPDGDTPKSFLAIDWHAYADTPTDEARRRFKIPPKSDQAIAAGSADPAPRRPVQLPTTTRRPRHPAPLPADLTPHPRQQGPTP